jgi:hypothetical protein
MSYENAENVTYTFTDATFGATTVTHRIVGPRGKVGFVRDIEVDVTTTLVGTTVPEIQVGTASADATYGRFRLGPSINLGYTSSHVYRASTLTTGNPPRSLADYATHVLLDGGPLGTSGSVGGGSWTTMNPAGRIPANTEAVITCLAGGTNAAGGGVVRVTVSWVGTNTGASSA